MMRRIGVYIHERKEWPEFTWDQEKLLLVLLNVRNKQGRLVGFMESLGFSSKTESILATLTLDILKSNEIEGELLDQDQVRSSIARRLGMDIAGLIPADRHIEGVVEMMLDATQNYQQPLTKERLFNWHASLFPTGKSGMYKILVGEWRNDETGPMQVVSGALGKEKIHYEAPAADRLDKEMELFLDWFNNENVPDAVLKAALAHFWFITIHPFDDGNGRIARALADMQLARADGSSQRFYSMSAQIRKQRNEYYNLLETSQKGSLNISAWLLWFMNCLSESLDASEENLAGILAKTRFWQRHSDKTLNVRQRTMLNKLFDGFEGKLSSSKWSKIMKCSPDTALRDIQDLIEKEMLRKESAGGRSTNYVVNL